MSTTGNKRGRPKGSGKISEEVIDKICNGIASGMTYEGAASAAGIHISTFKAWRTKGDQAQRGIYRTFKTALDAAVLKSRNLVEVQLMKQAMPHRVVKKKQVLNQKTGEIVWLEEHQEHVVDTRTLMFIAERRWPEDWGSKTQHDIKGQIEMPEINMDISDEAKELMKELFVVVEHEDN